MVAFKKEKKKKIHCSQKSLQMFPNRPNFQIFDRFKCLGGQRQNIGVIPQVVSCIAKCSYQKNVWKITI